MSTSTPNVERTCTDVLMCGCVDVLVCWCAGVLVLLCICVSLHVSSTAQFYQDGASSGAALTLHDTAHPSWVSGRGRLYATHLWFWFGKNMNLTGIVDTGYSTISWSNGKAWQRSA